MMVEVVSCITEITPEWLSLALQENRIIESAVSEVRIEKIGAGVGLMAELCRLSVVYAEEENAPATMIAKCAARNENIEVARILDFYNREANFYNRIGRACELKVPDCYFASVDQENYDCVILLEDLGDVSPRDQLAGASADEAFSAVGNIAAMHAKWWQRVDSADTAWMYDFMSQQESERLRDLIYLPAMEPAIEKFASFFGGEMKALCRAVGRHYDRFWTQLISPSETFIHGDYRQDNMIYSGDSLDAVVMDWQISGRGRGIFDVTYFICQSLPSSLRSEIEKELLTFYVASLRENGVDDYDFDRCWQDYRTVMLGCLIYPVTVCGTLDTANDRGRALAECMLERNLAAISDLGCKALVDEAGR